MATSSIRSDDGSFQRGVTAMVGALVVMVASFGAINTIAQRLLFRNFPAVCTYWLHRGKRQRLPPYRLLRLSIVNERSIMTLGTGAAAGAALGLLFGTMLLNDTPLGLLMGVIAGIAVGALVDRQRAR
jgi:hypothetical protein